MTFGPLDVDSLTRSGPNDKGAEGGGDEVLSGGAPLRELG